MVSKETLIRSFYEGFEWEGLYDKNPDPLFLPANIKVKGSELPLFKGKIRLSFWLGTSFPLPSIPLTFWGSPVTDLFPLCPLNEGEGKEAVKEVVKKAVRDRSWAVVVKDLPVGDPLEKALMDEGFIPVEHDPIWHTPVYDDLKTYLGRLSKGRRRGLEGRWKKFDQNVKVRPATVEDADFIKKSYDTVWMRAEMRLERLTKEFFVSSLAHPSCRFFIFEKDGSPFAFVMLWQKGNIWFDKYMGTDGSVYREVSFYSMSLLYLLKTAPSYGVEWYVAGQGAGRDKEGLGLERIDVRLWIKPLVLRFIVSPVLKRFMKKHYERVYAAKDALSPG